MILTTNYYDYVKTLLAKYIQHIKTTKEFLKSSQDNVKRWEKLQEVDFSETRASLIYYEKLHIDTFNKLIEEYTLIRLLLEREFENASAD